MSQQPALSSHVVHFSTDDLPEKDRLPRWREFYGRGICGLDYELPANRPFHGRAALTMLPDLNLMTGDMSSALQRRTRPLIAADGNCNLLLTLNPIAPSIATQRGRETLMTPGDATLLSSAEVAAMDYPQNSRFITFLIPPQRIAAIAPDIEDRLARRIPRDTPALRLLTGYVEAWRDGELAATPEMERAFSEHIYDLLELLFNAQGDAAAMAEQRGGRAARRVLIRREIDRGFNDPDFSLPALAQHIGITPRYAQMLLEEMNSSFVKEVTARRLKRAHEMLQSPRHRHLSIIEVAYECGFGTMAHFYRLFRHHYDITPGELRREMENPGKRG